jgi:hypothetical protein
MEAGMSRITDEDIGRMLRALPGERASAEFTSKVLSKLDARRSSLAARRRRRAVLATAAALALATVLSQGYLREQYDKSRAAARIEALREEYRELQVELDKLKALTHELEPVLELGGTEDVDFVLDLGELARRSPGEADPPKAEPASQGSTR